MNEVDKILYKLGYYDSDPHKKAEVQGYIDEAVEFMLDCGVKREKLTSQRHRNALAKQEKSSY